MNNSINIHQPFEGDKAVLANFFKSELSALIHSANCASVQAPKTTFGRG